MAARRFLAASISCSTWEAISSKRSLPCFSASSAWLKVGRVASHPIALFRFQFHQALNLRNFADYTDKLGPYSFTLDRLGATFPLVEYRLQFGLIAFLIRQIGFNHKFLTPCMGSCHRSPSQDGCALQFHDTTSLGFPKLRTLPVPAHEPYRRIELIARLGCGVCCFLSVLFGHLD